MAASVMFQFGEFRLEVVERRLTHRGEVIHLSPKALDVLVLLLRHAGHLVTKDDLLSRVWPDASVEEGILTVHISALRKALGDDTRSSGYIETVPRSGYRFVAPVRREQDDRDGLPLHAGEASVAQEGRAKPIDSLAVLAFADLSPQKNQEYFCDGLADELINALTRIRGLRVMSRTSSFQFKGASGDVREIGKRLGVRAVLEGSVRKSGERLRVTARITDVESGFTLSSEQYDRSIAEVLEIQADIARRVVQALEVRLSDSESRVLEKRVTADPRAYDLYLQGRGLFHQVRYETLVKARDRFLEAINVDPSFALAHSSLADVCSFLYQWRGRRAALLAEALSASARGLELRSDLAEVHAARGVALALSGNLDAAEREYRTAIDLNPDMFEPHYAYARACVEQGRMADAARLFERAAALRPEDYQSRALLALAYVGLGQPERARASYETAVTVGMRHVERHPDDVRAVYMVGNSLICLGEVDRGLDWVERARSIDPEDGGTLYNIACAYARAGRTEQALDTLEEALYRAVTTLAWIANYPDWSEFRSHSRFQVLLSRLR
jgi:TolB-like protein/Flp pilus assembly protein TadD